MAKKVQKAKKVQGPKGEVTNDEWKTEMIIGMNMNMNKKRNVMIFGTSVIIIQE